MAWVGAFAAVCNGGGRIIWGAVADRFSFKVGLCVCICERENSCTLCKHLGQMGGIRVRVWIGVI